MCLEARSVCMIHVCVYCVCIHIVCKIIPIFSFFETKKKKSHTQNLGIKDQNYHSQHAINRTRVILF